MAKKARSARGLTKGSNEKVARAIVKIWNDACKDGLGDKHLSREVKTKFEPRFFDNILEKLDDGDQFTAADKRKTKQVAKDVGRVCAMMASGSSISLDTFEEVFRLLKRHAACPRDDGGPGAGAGVWCDVPIT